MINIKINKKLLETLKEVLYNIALWGILLQVIGIIFIKDKAAYAIGLWMGIGMAALCVTNMSVVWEQAVELPEGKAGPYVAKYSMIRYILIIIVLACLMIFHIGDPLAAFFGLFGLKVAAYLQPFTHKILFKARRR